MVSVARQVAVQSVAVQMMPLASVAPLVTVQTVEPVPTVVQTGMLIQLVLAVAADVNLCVRMGSAIAIWIARSAMTIASMVLLQLHQLLQRLRLQQRQPRKQ